MKKLTVLSFTVICWVSAIAQLRVTDAGNFLMGTTLGLSSASSVVTQTDDAGQREEDRPQSVQFSFAPKVGYFLFDNFALGIGMDYTFSRVSDPNEDRVTDSDLLFGPFARYYFPVSADMAFMLEANFGFGNATDVINFDGQNRRLTTNIFAFGVGPGFTIVSDDAIGITAQLKYNYAQSRFDSDFGGISSVTETKTNQFDFSVGLQFYFSRIQPANK